MSNWVGPGIACPTVRRSQTMDVVLTPHRCILCTMSAGEPTNGGRSSPPKAESPTIELEYDDLFGRRWMTTVELDMTVVTDKFDGVHLAWRWRDLSLRSTRVRMVGAGTERPAREE